MGAPYPGEHAYERALLECAAGRSEPIASIHETVLDRGGAPLSGGQKQRIALAAHSSATLRWSCWASPTPTLIPPASRP